MKKALLTRVAITIGSCLLLAGCPSLHYAQCDGFSESNVASWSMGDEIGDTAAFVDNNGSPLELTLISRHDSEPHRTILRRKYEINEVPCKNWSIRRYGIEGMDTVLRITLSNVERFQGQSPDDQNLTLSITPENRDGVPDGNQFSFNAINNPESYYPREFQAFEPKINNQLKERYLVDATIGSERHAYVIEQKHDYPAVISLDDKRVAIRRVMIAKDAGIVQFEQYNGRVFTRAGLSSTQK